MESTADTQIMGSRRGTASLRADALHRRRLARMVPLPAVCAGCGKAVELRFEPTRWCEPGTFDTHACRVRRAS